jgi:WD40 repeat protein
MRCPTRSSLFAALAVLAACAPDAPTGPHPDASTPAFAKAGGYSSWSPAINVEWLPGTDPMFNTAFLDGCPFTSRDGKTFYMASNRPGGLGGIDIWVATRESARDPWGAPVNVGAPVNSAANDFCPTIARDGHLFYFVSNRAGGCGGDDIYVTRLRDDNGFDAPENVGCQVNSAANEASPFPIPEPASGPVLYFSSTRAGGFAPDAPGAVAGDADLYVSESHGGVFEPASLVPGANSAFNDGQPNVRRDALEIFFFSNRTGTLGGNDIYAASRAKATDPWSTPINLGPNVNSVVDDTRPSISWDGTTLYLGSPRLGGEGSSDIYVTTRERLLGGNE